MSNFYKVASLGLILVLYAKYIYGYYQRRSTRRISQYKSDSIVKLFEKVIYVFFSLFVFFQKFTYSKTSLIGTSIIRNTLTVKHFQFKPFQIEQIFWSPGRNLPKCIIPNTK